jgi:hypothetical protein
MFAAKNLKAHCDVALLLLVAIRGMRYLGNIFAVIKIRWPIGAQSSDHARTNQGNVSLTISVSLSISV